MHISDILDKISISISVFLIKKSNFDTDIPRLVNCYEGTLGNAFILNMFLKAGLLLLFSCIEKSKAENAGESLVRPECSKVCEHVAILIIFV